MTVKRNILVQPLLFRVRTAIYPLRSLRGRSAAQERYVRARLTSAGSRSRGTHASGGPEFKGELQR